MWIWEMSQSLWVHLSRKDFDTLKSRLKEKGAKYYDEHT